MFIDVIVLLLILAFFILGLLDGFIVSLLNFAAWFFGILSAWLFFGTFAAMLSANIGGLGPILSLCLGAVLAFLFPFLIIRLAAYIVKFFIKKIAPLTLVNRILGALFGLLKGIVAAMAILTFVHYLPLQGNLKHARQSSVTYSIYKTISFDKLWKDFKPDVTIEI